MLPLAKAVSYCVAELMFRRSVAMEFESLPLLGETAEKEGRQMIPLLIAVVVVRAPAGDQEYVAIEPPHTAVGLPPPLAG